MTIGVISDTHGLLRPEALNALSGVAHIIHAGDVGDPVILTDLATRAPLTVVRGNVDHGDWADELSTTEVATLAGQTFYVLHDIDRLDLDPAAAGFSVVVYGHSHRPSVERRNGVIFLNPGSAGPRRFTLPVSVAKVRITGGILEPELIELDIVAK